LPPGRKTPAITATRTARAIHRCDCGVTKFMRLRRGAKLFGIADNNFRPSSINRNVAANLHPAAGQRLEFPKFVFVRRENDAGERAVTIVGAEIEKSVSSERSVNAQDSALDAAAFARVRGRVAKFPTGGAGFRFCAHGGLCAAKPAAIRHHRAQDRGGKNYRNDTDELFSSHARLSSRPGCGFSARTQAVYQSAMMMETLVPLGCLRGLFASVPQLRRHLGNAAGMPHQLSRSLTVQFRPE
jgi:hypothetical protein